MNAIGTIWKQWPTDPRFTVGSDGTVIGLSGKAIKPRFNQSGYARIAINQSPGKNKDFYIHRMVLEAFIGPCPEGHEADHRNGIRSDNRISNLRWLSRAQNLARRKNRFGESHPRARLSSEDVRRIRLASGSQSQIAAQFGVSREHVRDIRLGKARANA